jgi:hypothetical protein
MGRFGGLRLPRIRRARMPGLQPQESGRGAIQCGATMPIHAQIGVRRLSLDVSSESSSPTLCGLCVRPGAGQCSISGLQTDDA